MITTVNLRKYYLLLYVLSLEPQSPAVDFLPAMYAREKIKSHSRTPPTTKISDFNCLC